jgi:hypothetical protein
MSLCAKKNCTNCGWVRPERGTWGKRIWWCPLGRILVTKKNDCGDWKKKNGGYDGR